MRRVLASVRWRFTLAHGCRDRGFAIALSRCDFIPTTTSRRRTRIRRSGFGIRSYGVEIDQPVLLINSDCELQARRIGSASMSETQFVKGRWNYQNDRTWITEFRIWARRVQFHAETSRAMIPDDLGSSRSVNRVGITPFRR